MFAFPLQIGNSCLGCSTSTAIYRDRAGGLSTRALDEASTFARLAMVELLDGHENMSAWLAGGRSTDDLLNDRLVVHQATGFVMAQLGVGADEAMLRLRAHSFASDRPISQVADDIVTRKLFLDRDVD